MQIVNNVSDVFDRYLQRLEKKTSIQTAFENEDVFEFEPVPLDVFITDKAFLGLPPLSSKQKEFVEYATQIYEPKELARLGWKRLRYVNVVLALWGKGSGKDFVSRIILLRLVYLLLALKNPQAYLYKSPTMSVGSERIDMLNTAVNAKQAESVFFAPLRKYVKNSPFFKSRCNVLSGELRFDKGIYLLSGHSEAESHEGLNLLAVVLDEIAAFKTDDEIELMRSKSVRKTMPMSASALYDFAMSTITTRFPKVGKVILLSYPRFEGDFITTKYRELKNDSKAFVSFGATYEVNPTKKKKDFEAEKKRNPLRYYARIECKPAVAEDAFFRNLEAVKKAFRKDLPNPVDMEVNRIRSWFICSDNYIRFAHVDLAKNRCRAAFAFVHAYGMDKRIAYTFDEVERTRKQTIVMLPLLKVDLIMYYEAPPGGEIDFSRVMDDIIDVIENRNFTTGLITFDGYNSLQMQQTLRQRGISVGDLSVDRNRKAYDALQDIVYDGRLISYYHPILVEQELPYLVDYRGTKIKHRLGRGKDGADALAGAVFNCIQSEMWGEMKIWTGGNIDDDWKQAIKQQPFE